MTWYGEDPKMNVADVNKVTWWVLSFAQISTHIHTFVPFMRARICVPLSSSTPLSPVLLSSTPLSFVYSFIHVLIHSCTYCNDFPGSEPPVPPSRQFPPTART